MHATPKIGQKASAVGCLLIAALILFTKGGYGQTASASWSAFPFTASVPNDTTTGTVVNHLAKLTSGGKAVMTSAGDSTGIIGIVVQAAGRTGSPVLAAGGQAPCAFDGATVAGDYVQASFTLAGDCHDAGAAYPTSGNVIGRVTSSNQGMGTYLVLVFPGEQKPVTGNVATATALAGTPNTCPVGQGQVALGIQASGNAVCSQLPPASSTAAGVVQLGNTATTAAAGNDNRITGALQSSSLGTANGPAQLDPNAKFAWANLSGIPGFGTAAYQPAGAFDAAGAATSAVASIPTASTTRAGIVQLGTAASNAAAGNDPRFTGALQSSTLGTANGPAQLDANAKFAWTNLSGVPGFGTAAYQPAGAFDAAGAAASAVAAIPTASVTGAGIVQLGTAATNAVAGNDPRITGALQSSTLGTARGPAQLDANAKFAWTNLSGVPGFGTAAYQPAGAFDAAGAATAAVAQIPTASLTSPGIVQLGTAATNAVAGNDPRITGALQSSTLGTARGPAQLDANAKFAWANLSGVPGFGTAAYQPTGAFDVAGAATAAVAQIPTASSTGAGIVQLGTGPTNAAAGNDSRITGALQSSTLGIANGPAQLDANAKFAWANLSGVPGFGTAAYQATSAFEAAGTAASAVASIPTASTTSSGLIASADWNTFNGKQSAMGVVNVKDYGAKGDGSTNDTAAIQRALTAAGTSGSTAYFPTGTYMVSAPLEVSSAVRLAESATIRASAAMSAVVRIGSSAAVVDGFFKGGIIDANNLANDGLIARQYRHIQIADTSVLNALVNGFHMGDSTLPGSSYEAILTGIHTRRITGSLASGSAGILIDSNATDNNVADVVLVGSDIGLKTLTGGNFFTNIHVWAGQSAGWMSVGFDDYGLGNLWKGCEADTVSTYGLRLRSFNSIVQGCRFYNNNVYGQDNVAIGIHFDQTAPYATVQGNVFQGADGTHRMATDIDISSTYAITALGNQDVNVATQLAAGLVVNGTVAAAGTVSSHGSLIAVPASPATSTQNTSSTLSLNANYWNTTTASQNTYAWNMNTGQNSSGMLTQPQLYFYMTGNVPPGVSGTLVYGANAAVSGQNNSSLRHAYQGSYYDGTCNCVKYDTWSIQNVMGGGANNPTNPTSMFSIYHSGSPGTAAVAVPALAVGGDALFSAAPRMMWSTFGACSPQISNCYESALWTPGKAISITQWTLNLQTPPSGCTSYPVISIKQGSTVLLSLTPVSGQGDYTAGSGNFPIAVNPANGALRVLVSVGGSGCASYGYGISSNIEYMMQ